MSAPDAHTLYDLSAEFRAFLAVWDEERRCPLPLVDYLLEQELSRQAEAARWAATEPERSVLSPSPTERGGSCGPYPTLLKGWYWNSSQTEAMYAHSVPVHVDTEPEGHYRRHATAIGAILWLLDHWHPREAEPQ